MTIFQDLCDQISDAYLLMTVNSLCPWGAAGLREQTIGYRFLGSCSTRSHEYLPEVTRSLLCPAEGKIHCRFILWFVNAVIISVLFTVLFEVGDELWIPKLDSYLTK